MPVTVTALVRKSLLEHIQIIDTWTFRSKLMMTGMSLPALGLILSPYLIGMRQVRDTFANRFAKPSRIFTKRSHGIAKSSHASRTRRERFAKVLNMIYFLCDKNHRKTVAKSTHMSRTRRQPFADVRKHICTMR